MFIRVFVRLILFLLLTHCSLPEGSSSDNAVVEQVIGERVFSEKNDKWVGTGRLMMADTLRSQRETIHVYLNAQFLNDSSFLVLHLFFDEFNYDTGLQIRFKQLHSEIDDEESHSRV